MQHLTDRVEPTYFARQTPRPWSFGLVVGIIGDTLSERPYAMLDPLLISGVILAVITRAVSGPDILVALGVALALTRLVMGGRSLWRRVWGEIRLLRYGQMILAHVLKLRPYRTLAGEIHGALLDCAVPLTERRVYVGSVWFADGNEALRLSQKGRIEVIALPTTPGTWRVIESVAGEVRYDRSNPVLTLPEP